MGSTSSQSQAGEELQLFAPRKQRQGLPLLTILLDATGNDGTPPLYLLHKYILSCQCTK